jgi:diguanylate cyclase
LTANRGALLINLQQIILFSAGLVVGMAFLPVLSRIFSPGSVNHFFDFLGRVVAAPFQLLGRIMRRGVDSKRVGRKAATGSVRIDAREQRINDSAQAIRSMLLVLIAAIQRTDLAATSSSRTLAEARNLVNGMGLPRDLALTASHLVAQIDRVYDSNSVLKGELASSQEILTTQQQMIEALRTAVSIDSMTQLANRSHFDDRLDEVLKLKQRYNDSFFVMIIDVDNFKVINDSYGHQAGDRILKGVAFKLKNTLRDSDFVARFGGDEFALLLIKADQKSAANLAWKICENLRDSRFLLDGNDITVTVSIGAAEAVAGDTADSLLRRADIALYHVKDSGRNGVMFADLPEPASEPKSTFSESKA